jgi:uncharacterized protein (TIGR03435 family)
MLALSLTLALVSPVSIEEVPFKFIAGRPVLSEVEPGKLQGDNLHVFAIFERVHEVERVEFPKGFERRRFRVSVEAPDGKTETARNLLKQAMHLKLGLRATVKEVELLRPALIKIGDLDPSMIRSAKGDESKGFYGLDKVVVRDRDLKSFARSLGERRFPDNKERGIDETGLTGKYDIDLMWDKTRPESIDKVLAQTGLALTLQPFKTKVAVVEQVQPLGG